MRRWLLRIAVGLAGVYLLAVISFGIGQAFIWRLVFNESPPTATSELASTLQVIVAVIGLSVTGFGVLAYQLARFKLDDRIEDRAAEIQVEVSQTSEVSDEAIVLLLLRDAIRLWEDYRDEWAAKGWTEELGEPERQLATGARQSAERALGVVRNMPGDRYKNRLQDARNDTAFHLASLKERPNDALAMMQEIEEDSGGLPAPYKETLAWLLLRFNVDTERGRGLIRDVIRDPSLTEQIRKELIERYRGLFDIDLSTVV